MAEASTRANKPPYNSIILAMTVRFWQERLTRAGRYAALGGMVTVVSGSLPTHMVGRYAFSFFMSLALVSLIWSWCLNPRLRAVRRLPRRCGAGDSVPVEITLFNDGGGTVCDAGAYEYRLPRGLKLEPDPRYTRVISSGDRHAFVYQLTAAKRGRYLLPGPTTLCAFPFAITQAKRFFHAPATLRVHPAYRPIERLVLPEGMGDRRGTGGGIDRAGQSTEFFSNREYRVGDRMRDLHPRSSARLGVPVVRQYREERHMRAMLLVDTAVSRWQSRRLEAVLSLAAALADRLSMDGHGLEMRMTGPGDRVVRSDPRTCRIEPLLDRLAEAGRGRLHDLENLMDDQTDASSMIVVLAGWDPVRARWIQSLRATGLGVRAFAVGLNGVDAQAAQAADVQVLEIKSIHAGGLML